MHMDRSVPGFHLKRTCMVEPGILQNLHLAHGFLSMWIIFHLVLSRTKARSAIFTILNPRQLQDMHQNMYTNLTFMNVSEANTRI